jgi:glucosamine--fructose-6-phosphate aminotransferase (isomerizing)
MCGIVAYVGERKAYPIIILRAQAPGIPWLRQRRVALIDHEKLNVFKCQGKVSDLEAHVNGHDVGRHHGMGHTRWATHGQPNDINAHPHVSTSGDLAIIHNGIIENYASIKEELKHRGRVFKSETDTEVLVQLIDDVPAQRGVDLPRR